jgi:DNA polymerase-3 subunit beta
MDLTIGRKGLLGYLKALGGSNVIKVIPSNGSASGSQADGHKRLKVICGANTSCLADGEWIGEKTPLTLCDVRVSPSNSVIPNVGANELAEALARVLPFTARDDSRPILQCVRFEAKDGKLTLVSADGFRLAVLSLDYDGEGQALINRDDLKGVSSALRRAKRASVSFEPSGDSLEGMSLVIDTEQVRYRWTSVNGNYPDWQKLIPSDFKCYAHFDTVEAVKAVNSLKALSDSKSYPIDLAIGDGKVVMANPDDKGQAELSADTDGQGFIRLDGQYLADILKACGGMMDFSINSASSPMLFSQDGYQVVVMPMITEKAKAEAKEAKAEAATAEQAETEAEPEAEKPKGKRSRAKKEAVTV